MTNYLVLTASLVLLFFATRGYCQKAVEASLLKVYSPDHTQLVESDRHKTRIYQVASAEMHLITTFSFPVSSVQFSHTGKWVYLLDSRNPFKATLLLYSTDTWKKLHQSHLTTLTGGISLNANDSLICYPSLGKIKTSDARTLEPGRVYWERISAKKAVFDPVNPERCIVTSSKEQVWVIDLPKDSVLFTTNKPVDPVSGPLQPYHPPVAEKFFSPSIGYAPEMGFMLGFGLTGIVQPVTPSTYYRPSVYNASLNYGFGGNSFLARASASSYWVKKWWIAADLGYNAHGRNFYFGIGQQTSIKDKYAYYSDNLRLDGNFSYNIGQTLSMGVAYDVRHNTQAGFQHKLDSAPYGYAGGTLFGTGPILRWDTRNNILQPNRGHLLDMRYLYYSGNYQYDETLIDYRQYIPLGAPGRLLAIQGRADLTWGGTPPFYSLPYFTSDLALRGIYRNLYIDNQVAFVQAEYRSYFRDTDPRFGYALFAGAADGATDFFKGYHSGIKGVYGLGLRQQLYPQNSLLLRLDFAMTPEGVFGCYAGLGVAF